MLAIDGKVLSQPTERQIMTVVVQNCRKAAAKHSIAKPMLLNFVHLLTIFHVGIIY